MNMFIKISGLSDGVYTYKFDAPVSDVGLEGLFTGNLQVDYKLNKFNNQIVLSGNIKLQATLMCDRCLTNYDKIINANYQMVYFIGEQPDDLSKDESNISYIPVDADKIYLSNDIRDYSILSIPMKKLCKEDCKGLCQRCGMNLNEGLCSCPKEVVDERWLPLLELKRKFGNN
jgi:DUF177 domain-containing protein